MKIPLWIILVYSCSSVPWSATSVVHVLQKKCHLALGIDSVGSGPFLLHIIFFYFRHRLDGIKKGFLAGELNIQVSLSGYSHGCQLCYGWDSWHIHVSHLFSEAGREEGSPVNFQWCKLDIHDFAVVRSFLSIHCCPQINTEPKDTFKP